MCVYVCVFYTGCRMCSSHTEYMCVIQKGRTAVMYAVTGGHLDITQFLTISGADLTITDDVSMKHTATMCTWLNLVCSI